MSGSLLLEQFREKLRQLRLDAFIVAATDAHCSEYLAEVDQRRAFISKFTGSAGWALITMDKALLWTDGRYYLQAGKQLSSDWTLMKFGLPSTPSMSDWILANCQKHQRIGFDEESTDVPSYQANLTKLKDYQLIAVPSKDNPVDMVWADKPQRVFNPLMVLDVKYAGQSAEQKLRKLREYLQKEKGEHCLGTFISSLDEIAYLLNIRSSDIDYNPYFFSYLYVSARDGGDIVLFTDVSMDKYVGSTAVGPYLAQLKVQVKPYNSWRQYLGMEVVGSYKSIEDFVVASDTIHVGVLNSVGGKDRLKTEKSVIQHWKAIKNDTEQNGFRECHINDAAALCMYFGWLEKQLVQQKNQNIDEVDGADKAEYFRKKMLMFVSLSFDTISGIGPNGAIIHYKPEKGKCSVITPDQVYLCDSGGQYMNGTTDVTRTMYFGSNPEQKFKFAFTSVLKSHLALSMATFPPNSSGFKLDSICRASMWKYGMDYRHGTGHGVGHFSGVHEGPHSVSFRKTADDVPLKEGMTVTIEPGFYLDNQFGIRIENVCLVGKATQLPYQFGCDSPDECFLGFEAVTMVPYGRNLIDISMLSDEEVKFVDQYHRKCYDKVAPVLQQIGGEEGRLGLEWLQRETRPLK
ncbi:hypothetical protein MP228_003132 [Amoeboaphelidium protococcarum]|nr:hypothetical protein MP228_003132 [Amoeboaphelidium protococcarum]